MDKYYEEFEIASQKVNIELYRIIKSYNTIKKYIGTNWFEKFGRNPKIIPHVLEMLLLGESILAVERIGSPNKIINRLVSPNNAEEFLSARAEAQVIHKFLELKLENIKYEPPINFTSRKPDVTHDFNSDIIQYEVTKPKLSARDTEMWYKRQKDLSDKLESLIEYGSLDIYLFNEEINETTINKIIDECKEFLNSPKDERLLPQIAFLVFDSTGSVQLEGHKTSFPVIRADGSIGTLLHDCKYDRSLKYLEKFNFKKPCTNIARVKCNDREGRKKISIVRIFRPSEDKRLAMQIIDESMQLSDAHPSIVVIEMGAPSAKMGMWAKLTEELFDSKIYTIPSGVLLRTLHFGINVFIWNEILVENPYSLKKLPEGLVKTLIPMGKVIQGIDLYLE